MVEMGITVTDINVDIYEINLLSNIKTTFYGGESSHFFFKNQEQVLEKFCPLIRIKVNSNIKASNVIMEKLYNYVFFSFLVACPLDRSRNCNDR